MKKRSLVQTVQRLVIGQTFTIVQLISLYVFFDSFMHLILWETRHVAEIYVTCSHEMIDKSRHAVPRFSLKTVVGVNLGEIEIFALYRSSFIFAPYTCSFLLYSTHKCFKFCK